MPSLDWKQQKNKCVADVGTIFCVELKADGWACSATPPGGKPEALATKLPNEKAAKRVANRAANKAGVAAPGRGRGAKRGPKKAAAKTAARRKPEDSPDSQAAAPEPPPVDAPSLPPGIEVLTDGCLCGRVRGVRWVADHKGNIQYLADVKPSDHAAVQSLVETHFAKRRTDSNPEKPVADDGARKVTKRGAARQRDRGGAQKAAAVPQASKKRGPGRPPKNSSSEIPRRGPGRPPKSSAAAEPPKRRPGRPPKSAKAAAEAVPSEAPKRRGRPPKVAAPAASKSVPSEAPKRRGRPPKVAAPAAGEGVRSEAPKRRGRPPKAAAPAAGEAVPGEAPKRRGRPPKDPNAPRRGPGRPRKAPVAADPASPEPPKEASGLRWIDVEGRRQATTADGSWQIMPEGSSFGLYYLNPSGASRFIASGAMSQLEQIALEKQARGGMGESPRSTSAVEKLFEAELNGRA